MSNHQQPASFINNHPWPSMAIIHHLWLCYPIINNHYTTIITSLPSLANISNNWLHWPALSLALAIISKHHHNQHSCFTITLSLSARPCSPTTMVPASVTWIWERSWCKKPKKVPSTESLGWRCRLNGWDEMVTSDDVGQPQTSELWPIFFKPFVDALIAKFSSTNYPTINQLGAIQV